MSKIKVTINGETHEVEQSAIDAGDLQLVDPNSPPKGLFNQDGVNRIVQEAKQGLENPNTLLKDTTHQQKVLSQFGIALDDNGQPKGLKSDLDEQKLYQQYEQKHLKPLQEEKQTLTKKIEQLHQSVVGEKVQSMAQKYLKPEAANNPFFTNGLKSAFAFDGDSGKVVPLGEDGKPIRHGNGQLATMEEYFEQEVKSGSLKDIALDKRPGSSGFQGGGKNDVSKTITRTEFDSLSPSEQHNSIKEGVKVVD